MKNLSAAIYISILFLLLITSPSVAQNRHYHFEQAKDMIWGSRYGQVYKIPKDSVYEMVISNKPISPHADWLQQPLRSIKTTQFDSLLKTAAIEPGYYVMIYAEQNRVNYQLRRKSGISAALVKLHNKDFIEVKDAEGNIIADALINYSGKKLIYDPVLKAYPVKIERKKRSLTVQKGNDIILLSSYAGKINNNGFSRASATNGGYTDHYSGYYLNNIAYKGYLVTNKPNYLPGDTVKYKAYLLDSETNEPVTEPLDIYIEGANKTSLIHSIVARDSGVYFNEFVLGDSILPDQKYSLMIKGKESQAFFRQTFKVEDYLLDDTYLRVNTEHLETYQKGDSIHLYAYAYNTNGLPLIDATLDLYIRSGKVKLKNNNPNTFIPDTLLHKHFEVATGGDTYLGFPTDSLPHLDSIELIATVRLKNANNEIKDTTFTLNYNSKKTYLSITESGNNLKADLISNKRASSGKGFYHRNGVFRDSISYPFSHTIHTNDMSYTFFETDDTGGVKSSLHYTISNDQIQIRETYFKDTASFEIINPQKIWMRYAVYERNKFLYYGHTNQDTIIKQLSKRDNTFTLIASHNWRNQAMTKQAKAFKIKTKMLIDINKKDIVYPGQKDSVEVTLKNPDDKGIANTNVTVLAFNAKFKEDFTTRLESSGYIEPGLKDLKRYTGLKAEGGFHTYRSEKLSSGWSRLLGTDTGFFYSKIYQDTSDMLLYSFNIEDTQYAQVAIYVKEDSNYVQPDLIYFDSRLAYIRVADIGTDPDALRANETVKRISFRSAKNSYLINNIQLKKGTKTNIFINGDSIHSQSRYDDKLYVIKNAQADSLSGSERQALSNALFSYKSEYNTPYLIRQRERLFVSDRNAVFSNKINYYIGNPSYGPSKIGPVDIQDLLLFFQQGNTKMTLAPELNFTYSLRQGMMRMLQETQDPVQKYNYKIPRSSINPGFNKVYRPIVEPDTLQLIIDSGYLKSPRYELHYNVRDRHNPIYATNKGNISLIVPEKQGIKSLFFIPLNEEQSPRVYDGWFTKGASFIIEPGAYKLFVLWADTSISTINLLDIKPGGRNIFNLDIEKQKITYTQLPKEIRKFVYAINDTINPVLHKDTKRIYGRVTGNYGEIIEAATIMIEGTNTGVVTDKNGYFSIDAPINGTIIAEYFGYNPKGVVIDDKTFYGIVLYLSAASIAYEGVTVFGKKIDRHTYVGSIHTVTAEEIERRPVVNAASALSGTVPGITITTGNGQPGSNPEIMLRGMGSISRNDGLIEIETKTESKKSKKENFLQSQQAQDFISGFMEDMQAASGMRNDFRDWAIWEPNLWTDKEGKVSFEANYPGTATSWKTYVLAMNSKGFAASALYITKSFKPLSATLSLPRFLRYGDSVEAVGNVINYTGTPFLIKTLFNSPLKEQTSDLMEVKAGKAEKILITAPQKNLADTGALTASFSLETEKGYRDGEEKTIPILPVGLIERRGLFTQLPGDTSFSTSPHIYGKEYFTGKTTISIEGSLIDVMMQEIENLKEYPHGCTEQITSKLLSIHYEEVLKQLMGRKDFNNKRTKKIIINKLADAQNRDGSFGWFANNSGDIRVSNYVLNALIKIDNDGTLRPVIDEGYKFLRNNLANMDTLNRIASLSTLSTAGQKAEYAFYIAGIDTTRLDYYNKFALLKIKKEQGFDYKQELDTLLKKANVDDRGLSWGKDSYDWYRNQLATTLLAYQLIENDTAYASVKKQVIDYLLFKRNKGYYRNTAESGLVLSTLLPGLIKEQQTGKKQVFKTKVHISGSHEEEINAFPKRIALNNKDVKLDIRKEGFAPAYITVNYEFFNPDAAKKEGTFIVSSTFKDNGGTRQETLKHGESLKLIIKVEVIKDAEYVLIDVPLPAGCIPLPKSISNAYEANRANFKDKTSIYCNHLPKGVHYFEIEVQARFKGSFKLSPASAAMMYFPDEQGNTEVKRIEIR